MLHALLGIDGMITGQVSSLGGTTTTSGAPTSSESNPIQYIITIIIKTFIGCWLIYIALFCSSDAE